MTRHGIITQARQEPCTVCHAHSPDLCQRCPDGVHLCRARLAAVDGLITWRDITIEMRRLRVFDGRTLLLEVA